MVKTGSERREAKRYEVDRAVCLWHESAQRFYNARSVNISNSGALIQLPLTVPILMEEKVDLNFPVNNDTSDCDCKNHADLIKTARVVRVNRGQTVLQGCQSVALLFC